MVQQLFLISEAARQLQLSEATVRRYVDTGRLKGAVRAGPAGYRLLPADSVEKLRLELEQRRVQRREA